MTTDTQHLWKARARQLDVYRWALLREKYGVTGSLLRVLRDATLDFTLGLAACLRATRAVQSAATGILVLHGSPKLLAQRRKSGLIEALRARGHEVSEDAIEPLSTAIRRKCLHRPMAKVPLRYYAHAAYAEWLARRGNPRLVLNERHGSLVMPFLRLALNAQGKRLAQLSHATLVDRSRRLSMTDYDYYLLFGQSSLDALQRRTLRFGSTRTILAGSYLIDRQYDLPMAASGLRVLVLGVGPDKEARPSIHLARPDASLAAALEQNSVVLNIMSNAALEASLAQRPVIYINVSDDPDILEQARFFGECVTDLDMLEKRLDWLPRNYQQAVCETRAFARYHLAHGVQGQCRTAEVIDRLVHRQPLAAFELAGTIG